MEVNSNDLIQATLGDKFKVHKRRKIGAAHSGHGVLFGEYEGVDVAVKPYLGKKAVQRAEYEQRMYNVVGALGFKTLQPLMVMPGESGALLLTEYVNGMVGLSGLTLNASRKSERGKESAQAVACTVITLAEMHHENVTHGDPQGKNWGFKVAEMTVDAAEKPLAFDLEKATRHGATSQYRESAIKRDLQALTFTLGSRGFGGTNTHGAQSLFFETVLEPYVETRLTAGVCVDNLGPIAEFALQNFERTRLNYQRPDIKPPRF